MLRSLLGADRGCAGFPEAGKSQHDVPSALITCGMREGTCEEVSQFRRVGVGVGHDAIDGASAERIPTDEKRMEREDHA